MLENSTSNNDLIERRCVLIKENGDLEEVKVCLANKEAVKELLGGDAEFKGEMEDQHIAILGVKDSEGMEENDLGFELSPPQETLYGKLLAFLVGENEKPIDLTASYFKRSKKRLRKKQNKDEQEAIVEKEEETKSAETATCDVFVNGIPYDTKEEDIRSVFEDCGTIQEIRLPVFQDSGRCRGYCFITFSSHEEAEKALSKDKQHIGNRYIDVALSTASNDDTPKIGGKDVVVPIDCHCIFVKGIPYDTTEEQVREVLMRFGKIIEVRIPRWNDTGRIKGICYVEYKNVESVKHAVAQSGKVEMGGRRLWIDADTGKPKSSFRTAEGKLWSNEHKGNNKRSKPTSGPSMKKTKTV